MSAALSNPEGGGPLGRSVSAGKENTHSQAGAGTPTKGKMAEILHNHLTCPICQEWLLACHTLSCGHMFCGPCLATWLMQKQTCPSCRKPVAGGCGSLPDWPRCTLGSAWVPVPVFACLPFLHGLNPHMQSLSPNPPPQD